MKIFLYVVDCPFNSLLVSVKSQLFIVTLFFPSITIPDGFVNGLPVGLNITGNCYNDQTVLNIAYGIENTMNYKNQIAKEVNLWVTNYN